VPDLTLVNPWVFVTAAGVTWLLIFVALKTRLRLPMDRPNERSLHQVPVPRFGGIAIIVGVTVAVALAPQRAAFWPLSGALALALVSLVDDFRSLPMTLRLATHLIVASVFVSYGFYVPLEAPAMVATVLAIVWMVNLYNFMDGADGLAGGMALFGFVAYFLGFAHAQQLELAVLSGAICAAALGFLWFNFAPARVFMGDGGSIPLGFLAGSLGMYGWARQCWPIWFPIVVFLPFIVDATLTLVRRILAGERFWQAHREHSYQRLVRMGFGHRKVALWHYGLMLLSGSCALLGMYQPQLPSGLPIAAALALNLGFYLWATKRWQRHIA
jgi:UDP-N-acetylmuramyl pentapeptide phosphotransferase/UDP-N-acetylglucosamine-1-phosphate transferase